MATKTDAWTLDTATLTHLRRSVVKAVREGMTQTAAATTFGVSLRAVNKWMALDKAGGLRNLALKRRGRRPGSGRLTPKQATRIRQQIIDHMPDQLKLGFYLWTRAAVAQLIAREVGVGIALTTVGRYLKAWGMSAQNPCGGRTSNDAAIARWLRVGISDCPPGARGPRSTGATKWACGAIT